MDMEQQTRLRLAERIIEAFEVFQSGYWPCVDENTERQIKADVTWIRERYDALKWGLMSFSDAARQAKADFINTFFRLTPLQADAARPGEAEQLKLLAAQLKHGS